MMLFPSGVPQDPKREDVFMASPNVVELNEKNWKDHVGGDTLVVVDFWAPWCGPCRALSPIIDRLADRYAGQVKVAKINVDENPNLAAKYDVMTIPRIMFFKGSDQPLHQEVGLLSENRLSQLIDQYK